MRYQCCCPLVKKPQKTQSPWAAAHKASWHQEEARALDDSTRNWRQYMFLCFSDWVLLAAWSHLGVNKSVDQILGLAIRFAVKLKVQERGVIGHFNLTCTVAEMVYWCLSLWFNKSHHCLWVTCVSELCMIFVNIRCCIATFMQLESFCDVSLLLDPLSLCVQICAHVGYMSPMDRIYWAWESVCNLDLLLIPSPFSRSIAQIL